MKKVQTIERYIVTNSWLEDSLMEIVKLIKSKPNHLVTKLELLSDESIIVELEEIE